MRKSYESTVRRFSFFFSSRRRHTRLQGDWSSDVCSSDLWQNEVHQAFAGKPSHPVMRALMPHAPVYGIEERHLQAVIDGCRMDLEQTRYLDFQGLTR